MVVTEAKPKRNRSGTEGKNHGMRFGWAGADCEGAVIVHRAECEVLSEGPDGALTLQIEGSSLYFTRITKE